MVERSRAVCRSTVAVGVCGTALHATAATPARPLADARAALATGATGTDPFAAVVPVAALLAWALVLWLSATVLLTLATQLPGALGRCADAAVRLVAPAAVRRTVQLALGLSLAVGAAAGPAAAAPLAATDVPVAVAATPVTAGTPADVQAPSLDWPSAAHPAPAAPAAPVPTPAAAPAAAGQVVVAPGDTLWALAERALGPTATTGQVAAAWPAWWAANRDVVGADPDLIHPGDRLTPPATHR